MKRNNEKLKDTDISEKSKKKDESIVIIQESNTSKFIQTKKVLNINYSIMLTI